MKKGEGTSSSVHLWKDEEEWVLLDKTRALLETESYRKNKAKFCGIIAKQMNAHLAGKDHFVKLIGSKIRTKFTQYEGYLVANAQPVFAPLLSVAHM